MNAENQGGVGLEAKYESQLEGTSGLTVTAKNAKNTDLLYQYEQYYDAENGNSLVLTLEPRYSTLWKRIWRACWISSMPKTAEPVL